MTEPLFQPLSPIRVLVALSVLSVTFGCGRNEGTTVAPPTHVPQPAGTLEPTRTSPSRAVAPAPVCPPANGGGTISPAPGPDYTWTVDEGWTEISAVLNHWAPQDTADLDCADGRCEHDDWAIIAIAVAVKTTDNA
jgi:hypothetical protein